MLMTAAGTIPPAKVLVLGGGVAGLQAIATARRLGAQTTGYDVRPEVAEQVRSLGATWLDLGIEARGARAATPASSPTRSARSSSRRSRTRSRASTSSSRPRWCPGAPRRGW